MRINFSKLSRAEVDALVKQAANRIKELEHETIGAFVDDVKKRAEKAGISLHEIAVRLGGSNGAGKLSVARAPKQHPAKGIKVAAKYRHPATGETWSGRGRKAAWLEKEVASGKKLADFAVSEPAARNLGKVGKRGKVAAKYRNAKTGETWTGRGTRPRWLQKEIAGGKKVEAFAVK